MASSEHAFRLDTGAFRAARRARRARRAAYWLLLVGVAILLASLIGLAVMALGSAGGTARPHAPAPAAATKARAVAVTPAGPAPTAPLPVVPRSGAPAPATTTVAVWNGTRVTGLAGHTADRLRALGYPVGAIGDAPRHRFVRSFVLYGHGQGPAAWALARRLGMNPRLTVRPFDGPRNTLGVASLVVILGGR